MDRAEKEALIEELKEDLGGAAVVLVTRQSGMTVGEAADIRGKVAISKQPPCCKPARQDRGRRYAI